MIPRRTFLKTLSVAPSLLGAGALLEACATPSSLAHNVSGVQPASPRSTKWDMSWVARLNRPHRVVFDVTKIAEGNALWQASSWMQGYAEAEGATDADLNAVLVFRHSAVAMLLDDVMWTRLGVSSGRADGPATNSVAKRNPYLGDVNAPPAATNGMGGPVTIRRLMARGAIMLACNNALNGQAYGLKEKEGISEADAQAQIKASVTEGVYVMPNGIFSVARAQEAGCGLFIPG